MAEHHTAAVMAAVGDKESKSVIPASSLDYKRNALYYQLVNM